MTLPPINMPKWLLTILVLRFDTISGQCNPSSWKCSSGLECIDDTDVCDGVINCADGSDETFTICSNFTCPGYAFRCAYGACVDGDAACNGIINCADRSDELLPSCSGVKSAPASHNCKDLEFPCLDGRCIPVYNLCDGAPDCADKSDETITQCISFTCPEYSFRCAYGACVDGDAPCNKEKDCVDNSDEYAPQCNISGPTFLKEPEPNITDVVPNGPSTLACRLPPPPEHGTYISYQCFPGDTTPKCNAIAGTEVSIGFDLHYECYHGYTLKGIEEQYCRPWGWNPKGTPICTDECDPLVASRLELQCFSFDAAPIPCNRKVPPLSFARFTCRQAIYIKSREPGYNRITCRGGKWDKPLPDDICTPACGRAVLAFAQPVIRNGTVAQFSSFPWHAGIYEFKNKTKSFKQTCGGSLVSHNVVISAAHCFKKEIGLETVDRDIKNMRVGLGKFYRSFNKAEDKFAQIFELKQVIISPDYTGLKDNYADDIAVIILKTSANFEPAVLPVCMDLGKGNIEDSQLITGAFGEVAGWGLTEHGRPSEELMIARMPFVPRQVCLQSSTLFVYISKDKMCAGDPATTTTVCGGDSGGGFVFKDPNTNQYYLRGIVSLGMKDCVGQDYSLFTQISKHVDLIRKYT